MRRPRYNMGRVEWIGVEALGEPGRRTFRLLALSDTMSAQLWMEKEQLVGLARAIGRRLAEIDAASGETLKPERAEQVVPKPLNFPESPDLDFHVSQMALRYDPERDLIALEAFEVPAEPEERAEEEEEEGDEPADPPMLLCITTRGQMSALESNSLEVIAAGRPRCPLCGESLAAAGEPHFCPPSNGHNRG